MLLRLAVTQQFNTTTSMGRLLWMCCCPLHSSSGADGRAHPRQICGLAPQGHVDGGTIPLGYAFGDRKLVIMPTRPTVSAWSSSDILPSGEMRMTAALLVSCFVYQNPAKSGSFIKPPELQII